MSEPLENPIGISGIAFIEFTGPDPAALSKIFEALGFTRIAEHTGQSIDWYQQNNIIFMLNHAKSGFSAQFRDLHGPSVPSMGLLVANAEQAFQEAVRRGARPYDKGEQDLAGLPAVYGVGESLIYFVQGSAGSENGLRQNTLGTLSRLFREIPHTGTLSGKGFLKVDHLTNNVYKGTMAEWSAFYKSIFGFTEVRYFDIKGSKTGLTSYALRSPCGTFSIPLNEGNEEKSQIEEYLREYHGAGIQHIALATQNLLDTLDQLAGAGIETLDISPDYYEEAFQRVPNITEDKDHIRHHQVLVDGDEAGYLLQIFTRNLIGPVFFEFIQRKNHHSFGEGNFTALFQSIERDQERRGVL